MIVVKNENTNNGIGLLGCLGVLFIALKLLNVIDWSWWWVTAPFWGGAALFASLIILLPLVWVLFAAISVGVIAVWTYMIAGIEWCYDRYQDYVANRRHKKKNGDSPK